MVQADPKNLAFKTKRRIFSQTFAKKLSSKILMKGLFCKACEANTGSKTSPLSSPAAYPQPSLWKKATPKYLKKTIFPAQDQIVLSTRQTNLMRSVLDFQSAILPKKLLKKICLLSRVCRTSKSKHQRVKNWLRVLSILSGRNSC